MKFKKIKNVKLRFINYAKQGYPQEVFTIPEGYQFNIDKYLFVVVKDPLAYYTQWDVYHKLTGFKMTFNYVFETRKKAIDNALENYNRAVKVHGSFNSALKHGIKKVKNAM